MVAMKRLARAAAAALALMTAGAAEATVFTYHFTIESNDWFGTGLPYNLAPDPVLTGTVLLDDTKVGSAALTGVAYTTGSRTWTASDLDYTKSVVRYTAEGAVTSFDLVFKQLGNAVYLSNAAVIGDGTYLLGCNNCVTNDIPQPPPTGAPEPGTWAMMLLGLTILGFALRNPATRRLGALVA